MGTHLRTDGSHMLLTALDTPIKNVTSLSNTDFSNCFVEVDVVEMGVGEGTVTHLVVVPFQPQKYCQTCKHHLMHLDF